MKSDSALMSGVNLWDIENLLPKTGGYGPSSAHQPGSSPTGSSPPSALLANQRTALHFTSLSLGINLIEEHLQEVRCLRQRLEESIRTNERLRQQLEERLSFGGQGGGEGFLNRTAIIHDMKSHLFKFFFFPSGAPTNIYIQGMDSVTQLSNEIRILKQENLTLQSRLQASTGKQPDWLSRVAVSYQYQI